MTEQARPPARLQYTVLAVISLVTAGCGAALAVSHGALFKPFLGSLDPLMAIAVISVLGFASCSFLYASGRFEIFRSAQPLRGVFVATALATLFVVPTIAVDLFGRFPRDLNIPAPYSLLFYPAIAYVAETCFHLVPLALLLLSLGLVLRKDRSNTLAWSSILVVSFLEPAFQVLLGTSATHFSWMETYVALHVFAFNLAQLVLFQRYDFVSMFACRLVYYLYWHIAWGHLRIRWLF